MFSITGKNIKKYYGIDMILENVSFEIEDGQKAAIVGANGAGKTTLFKIISNELEYDSGEIYIAKGKKVGYLSQIPTFPDDYTIRDVISSAFENLHSLRIKLEELEMKMSKETDETELKLLMDSYDKMKYEFERNDGYNIEYKINMVASGLGISQEDFVKTFNMLSGGEKTRICMAKILAEDTDILLLDEPTNHLDMDSVEWLEEYLTAYKGTAIIISHDRYFMDKVVTKIIEIESGLSSIYAGNYSYYVEEKERRIEQKLKEYENQQEQIENMEEKISRFRDWSNYKAAMSIKKALDKIERVDKPIVKNKRMKLNFDANQKSGNDVMNIKNLCKSFGDKVLLEDAEMSLYSGSKAVLLGKNGTGKSTLVKMIMGEQYQDSGSIRLGTNVNIAYLEQQFDTLGGSIKSVVDYFMDVTRIDSIRTVRNILAAFLFFGEDVYKSVKDLSGGERTRLKLAELMHSQNNLLILDEPTNHLDIDSKEALEDAVCNYPGTILIISHDRYFINKVADVVFEIEDKQIKTFEGDYEYYKMKKAALNKKLEMLKFNNSKQKVAETKNEEQNAKDVAKADVPKKKRGNPTKEIERLERRIEKLENEINEIEEKMATPEVTANYEELIKYTNDKQEKEEELQSVYEEWESYM